MHFYIAGWLLIPVGLHALGGLGFDDSLKRINSLWGSGVDASVQTIEFADSFSEEEAFETRPFRRAFLPVLVRAYCVQGRLEEAQRWLRPYLDEFPESPMIADMILDFSDAVLASGSQSVDLQEWSAILLQEQEVSTRALYLRFCDAFIFYKHGHYQEADRILRAVEINDEVLGVAEYPLLRLFLDLKHDRLDEAFGTWKLFAHFTQGASDFWVSGLALVLGTQYAQAGRFGRAKTLLRFHLPHISHPDYFHSCHPTFSSSPRLKEIRQGLEQELQAFLQALTPSLVRQMRINALYRSESYAELGFLFQSYWDDPGSWSSALSYQYLNYLLAVDEIDEALTHLDWALATYPAHEVDWRYQQFKIAYDAGFWREAGAFLDRLIRDFPAHADLKNWRLSKAELCLRMGSFAEASSLLNGMGDALPVELMRCQALMGLRRYDEFGKKLNNLLTQYPDHPCLRGMYCQHLLCLQRWDELERELDGGKSEDLALGHMESLQKAFFLQRQNYTGLSALLVGKSVDEIFRDHDFPYLEALCQQGMADDMSALWERFFASAAGDDPVLAYALAKWIRLQDETLWTRMQQDVDLCPELRAWIEVDFDAKWQHAQNSFAEMNLPEDSRGASDMWRASLWYLRGMGCFYTHDASGARLWFERILLRFPDFFALDELRLFLAWLQIESGHWDYAEEQIAAVLQSKRSDYRFYGHCLALRYFWLRKDDSRAEIHARHLQIAYPDFLRMRRDSLLFLEDVPDSFFEMGDSDCLNHGEGLASGIQDEEAQR